MKTVPENCQLQEEINMPDSKFALVYKWTTLSLGAAFVGIAILTVAGITSIGSREANATPTYAGQVGKPCGFCHVSPTGGGKLNARGQKFQANGHKL